MGRNQIRRESGCSLWRRHVVNNNFVYFIVSGRVLVFVDFDHGVVRIDRRGRVTLNRGSIVLFSYCRICVCARLSTVIGGLPVSYFSAYPRPLAKRIVAKFDTECCEPRLQGSKLAVLNIDLTLQQIDDFFGFEQFAGQFGIVLCGRIKRFGE